MSVKPHRGDAQERVHSGSLSWLYTCNCLHDITTKCHTAAPRRAWVHLACDHALSLYLFNLFSGGEHDTFLLQITCKKARIWTFFWLDRKQYGWFALFRLAIMPTSVSCCWFFSLHFYLHINEQWIVKSEYYAREFVMKFLPAQFSWMWRMSK